MGFIGSDRTRSLPDDIAALKRKLNRLDPQRYLADVLARIADHPARHIAELLPWHWQPGIRRAPAPR
jgi:hypothetical protein